MGNKPRQEITHRISAELTMRAMTGSAGLGNIYLPLCSCRLVVIQPRTYYACWNACVEALSYFIRLLETVIRHRPSQNQITKIMVKHLQNHRAICLRPDEDHGLSTTH
jgi:hypothetical protein